MIHKTKHYAWKLFLLIYVGVLIHHLFETNFTYSLVGFLSAGFLFAVIAHRSNHWSSIPFLILHMVLEAMEFTSTGFSLGEIALFWILVHIAMDIGFLWDEVKRHFTYSRYILFSSILIAVATIYGFFPRGEVYTHSFLGNYHDQLELFVIGGVIGCVISHLVQRSHHHN